MQCIIYAHGEEIKITGAGSGGSDLTTIITNFINRDTFEIKDNLSANISSVNPSVTAGTWTSIA